MGEINSKLPEEIKFSRSNILTDALNRPVKSFSSADTAAVSKLPKKYPSVDNLSRYCDASTKHSTPLTNRCFSDNIDKISRPVVNNRNINLDVKKIFKPKRTERENNDEQKSKFVFCSALGCHVTSQHCHCIGSSEQLNDCYSYTAAKLM